MDMRTDEIADNSRPYAILARGSTLLPLVPQPITFNNQELQNFMAEVSCASSRAVCLHRRTPLLLLRIQIVCKICVL